jgi:spore coat protein CotH
MPPIARSRPGGPILACQSEVCATSVRTPRIKLNASSEIVGLKADKDWVLLANYRDPTFSMNAFAFEVANWMGLPYSNHSRFVEVTLNGDYIGLYQLTEQVEQSTNRVAVADDGGILLSLDADDGPVAVPNAGDNFTSTRYKLPVCVKYPESQTAAQLAAIKDDFAKVEDAIAAFNYDTLATLLSIPSLIDFLLLQEVTHNVELATPRSMYMHKNPGGVYVTGPAWDFDGGFDFNWTNMETSHDYFAQQELVMGTDPTRNQAISAFFLGMFKNQRFVAEYKARWAAIKGNVLSSCWGVMENDAASLASALDRNATRWPIGKDHRAETARMKQWLEARMTKLDSVINAYPAN